MGVGGRAAAEPPGPMAAYATSEEYAVKPDTHVPFHRYFFHMLTGQSNRARGVGEEVFGGREMVGGFAFVAYPAQYGNSGVMSFMITRWSLARKGLGKTTPELATATMTEFDPDDEWKALEKSPFFERLISRPAGIVPASCQFFLGEAADAGSVIFQRNWLK